MTLYEIDAQILSCVDTETGEIIDEEKLEALTMEREAKISGCCCWYKDLMAEAKALKEEKMELTRRQQVAENKAESVKKYIARALNGDKFKNARASVSYRKSESVCVEDIAALPDEFKKITVEPKKTELKEAMKAGKVFEGVTLEVKENVIIK